MKIKIFLLCILFVIILSGVCFAEPSPVNLQTLRLNVQGLSPAFNSDIKEYYLIVPMNVKELEITAVPVNSLANVEIVGNTNLEEGLNTIEVRVMLNDLTNVYTINITRTDNIEVANADLITLAIENIELSPAFDKNITSYSAETFNISEINVLAIPEDDGANVEIIGNNNLHIGTNEVKINVVAQNGISNKMYVITINNKLLLETSSTIENEEMKIDKLSSEVVVQNNQNFNIISLIIIMSSIIAIFYVNTKYYICITKM